jgi:hypothetical protein
MKKLLYLLLLTPIIYLTSCSKSSVTPEVENLYGCTDTLAFNFDSLVTVDDSSCSYQMTYVPDDNFEQELINLGYDNVLDDSVYTTSIQYVTSLNLNYKNINSLLGIEDFTALEYLNCSVNQITSLDVSQNTLLDSLDCCGNLLTSLDVSQNTNLIALYCHVNQLTNLDISQNTNLIALYCHVNQLTNLDISNGNNTNFTLFWAGSNDSLNCIEVDDSVWFTNNWQDNLDNNQYYSNSCQ